MDYYLFPLKHALCNHFVSILFICLIVLEVLAIRPVLTKLSYINQYTTNLTREWTYLVFLKNLHGQNTNFLPSVPACNWASSSKVVMILNLKAEILEANTGLFLRNFLRIRDLLIAIQITKEEKKMFEFSFFRSTHDHSKVENSRPFTGKPGIWATLVNYRNTCWQRLQGCKAVRKTVQCFLSTLTSTRYLKTLVYEYLHSKKYIDACKINESIILHRIK